jgi:hypothetical protein
MTDSTEHGCPNCGATDLVSIQTTAIDHRPLECQSCKRLCRVKYGPDGAVRTQLFYRVKL